MGGLSARRPDGVKSLLPFETPRVGMRKGRSTGVLRSRGWRVRVTRQGRTPHVDPLVIPL